MRSTKPTIPNPHNAHNPYKDSCIFFNVEVDTNNINSNDPNLGSIERVYEQEALRLIKSIRLSTAKQIKIYTILYKDIQEYEPQTIEMLKKETTILIPQLNSEQQKEISAFFSGFWYIPLTGVLMENTKKFQASPTEASPTEASPTEASPTEASILLDTNGNPACIKETFALKLDTDMIMLRNPFTLPEFISTEDTSRTTVIYYDKDWSPECDRRLIYGPDKLSNTCLIYSDLTKPIYDKWYQILITKPEIKDDIFEEVAFDIAWPYLRNNSLANIQIGENYLCPKDLNEEELNKILFYHHRVEADINPADLYKLIPELKLKVNAPLYSVLHKQRNQRNQN